MSEIYIILLDRSNNTKEKISIIKPKTYQELLNQIKQNFKSLPGNYEIFYFDNKNKVKINNNGIYKKIGDIIFIRELDNNILDLSVFEKNYNILSESKQDILDQKYNCILCQVIIKNEKPYLCYNCQKIFHEKCLKDWDMKCKEKNISLSCPNCRKELPLEKWNKKLDFEDNKKENAILINKINDFKLINTMVNNINEIKDKKIK